MGNIAKKNVLIVHNYYQIPGGEDTVVANEKSMLEKHGCRVVLYTRNNSEWKDMSKLRKLFLPFTTIYNTKTSREIKRIIRREKIDIVHVHNTLNLISPSVYYAARKCKVPVVQTVHNFRLLCPGATFYRDGHICEDCVNKGLGCAVKHRCYRGSKLQTLACVISTRFHRFTGIYKKINYICLTEFNQQKIMLLKGVSSENTFVKPNFVESRKEPLPLEKREQSFVFAGRIDKLKGIDILLKAWKIMGNDAPRLIICGTGPMEEWCREYITSNNLNAEMKGFIQNSEALDIIAVSRALILPTQWYEGFPMSIAEAFSTGTPVICSDLGNAGSLITEGKNGVKFKPDSPEELVEAVRRLDQYNDIYHSAYSIYCKNYTEEQNYAALMKIYDHLISD